MAFSIKTLLLRPFSGAKPAASSLNAARKTEYATIRYAADDGRLDALKIALPQPRNLASRSFFIFSLPKSGSVLVNGLAREICDLSGMAFLDLPTALFSNGITDSAVRDGADALIRENGCCFGGFRTPPIYISPEIIARVPAVFIVRDPRDMVVSHYYSVRFSHGQPGQSDGGLYKAYADWRKLTEELDVDAYSIKAAAIYAETLTGYKTTLAPARKTIFRYEEFVYDKESLMKGLCALAKVEISDADLRRAAAKYDIVPEREDPRQHVRQIAPGDHKRKLKPETIDQLNDIFKDFLLEFGY